MNCLNKEEENKKNVCARVCVSACSCRHVKKNKTEVRGTELLNTDVVDEVDVEVFSCRQCSEMKNNNNNPVFFFLASQCEDRCFIGFT